MTGDGLQVVLTGAGAGAAGAAVLAFLRWLITTLLAARGRGSTAQADVGGVSVQVGESGGGGLPDRCSDDVRRQLEVLDDRDRARLVNEGRLLEILAGVRAELEGLRQLYELALSAKDRRSPADG